MNLAKVPRPTKGDEMIKLNKLAHVWAVATVLAAFSGHASAQWYGGAAGGRAHINLDCAAAGDDTCNSSYRGYKAYLGYQSDEVFAVEAGYLNFGRYKETLGSNYIDTKIAGFLAAVAFRGTLMPELKVVGRLGITFLDTRVNGSINNTFYGEAEHSNRPYFGIGLEYEVMPQIKLTAAADFTKAAYDGQTASMRLLSLGVQGDF
jgi:OOP family OmpA-OmpF porin